MVGSVYAVDGETALLAFTSIQHGNKSMQLLSWIGLVHALKQWRFDIVSLRRQAKARARRAQLLVAQPWQQLLHKPLDEIRRQLGLDLLPPYRTFDLPN